MNQFLQKWGGWILAGLSSGGVLLTSVLTANEAPKAREAIEEAEAERELTFLDKCKIAAPIYAPAIISGALTVSGILGNQAINAKTQASLIAAGTAGVTIAAEYDKYRQAIRAEQGDAVDARALERAKMTEEALRSEIARLRRENGPYLYSIATLPELIFEARPADIQEAFMHFNRNLILKGQNDLAELYEFIGIPMEHYNLTEAERYGWNEYIDQVQFDYAYCDFDILDVKAQDGTVVKLIRMPVPPYDLTMDYEENDELHEHIYPGYEQELARQYIEGQERILPWTAQPIDHPYIRRCGLW